jgi:ABC-type transport system substrate-binding protein
MTFDFNRKRAISRGVAIGAVIIIALLAAGAYYLATNGGGPTGSSSSSSSTGTTSHTTSTSSTPQTQTFGPKNSSLLIDESQGAAPDYLDPGSAFFAQDSSYLTAVFEDLASYNGTDAFHQLPTEASGWTVANNSQEFIFTMRPDVYFSNGDNVTAYTIWFSYVREIYINAPSLVSTSNWNLLTENVGTDWFTSTCSINEPWGLTAAVGAVDNIAIGTASSCKPLANAINSMLSNFNPSDSKQAAIMANPHQAYSAPNASTFIIRTMNPYAFVVSNLAGFSGTHTVDPKFVDLHGGVSNNTLNTYLDSNCEPGTGPYVCTSVSGSPVNEVVLTQNTHYWAAGSGQNGLKPGLPWVTRPAQIAVIDIKYALTGTPVYQDFGTNVAAIGPQNPAGSASIPEWGQMWAAYQHKNWFKFSQINKDFGSQDFSFYLGLNSQRFPSNITAFRQAVYWAMNYTQLAQTEVSYNGTAYGVTVVGPAMPTYGNLYNPNNLPVPSQNIPLALHYIDLAGKQGHFYVVLSNGTQLGDKTAQQLPTLDLVTIAPISPSTEVQLRIYQDNLALIGVAADIRPITSAYYNTLASSPTTAPIFNNIGWGLDYPDPWLQQFVCFYTTNCGIATYINNATVANLVETASFNPDPAAQLQAVKQLYNISASEAWYIWLPFPDQTFFIEPYVQGMQYNIYVSEWYNLLYYQPVTVQG